MSGELEAAGALGTAGLAAGAIEGREATREGDGLCANCGAQLAGRYCSNCGQAAHAHRSLLHMGEELLYGLFNFDTKLWRTLPMVFFRPGTLTRNYIFGKRARYISPLALFLFCVFFLFFVVSLVPAPVNVNSPETQSDAQEQVDDARSGVRELQQELQELRQDVAREGADAGDRAQEAGLQTALTAAQAQLQRSEQALAAMLAAERNSQPGLRVGTTVDPNQTGPSASIITGTPAPPPSPAPTTASAPSASPSATPAVPAVPQAHNPYPQGSLENALYGLSQNNDIHLDDNPALAQRIRHKLENPPLLLYKLQEAASKFSFLLVPISLPFIAFLFLFKKNITLYDHTVFAFYALCFASLLFVVLLATGSVPWLSWLPGMLIAFGLPVHMYSHLRGAYALRWWSALWRTLFLLFFSVIALALFLALVLFVGFAE